MLSPTDLLPQRIVCLTEETTEWLYLLGEDARIVGISGFTVRPKHARHEKPRVSAFLTAKTDQILALQPDWVLGFSDLQADIAQDLIKRGVQVMVFNQRSVREIFAVLAQLGALVGAQERSAAWLDERQAALTSMRAEADAWALKLGGQRPKVYFEEWDEPRMSCIRWVSELVGIAGGVDVFDEVSRASLGKDRIVDDTRILASRPDIIIGSWCGKKFRPEKVAAREGYASLSAVMDAQVFEIKSPDILQPGPAALTDGVAQLHDIVRRWYVRKGVAA
jgi:iron complex transport system substrate-binding protein